MKLNCSLILSSYNPVMKFLLVSILSTHLNISLVAIRAAHLNCGKCWSSFAVVSNNRVLNPIQHLIGFSAKTMFTLKLHVKNGPFSNPKPFLWRRDVEHYSWIVSTQLISHFLFAIPFYSAKCTWRSLSAPLIIAKYILHCTITLHKYTTLVQYALFTLDKNRTNIG